MVNFNFSDYIAVVALIFLLISVANFKEPSISRFFVTVYAVLTIYAAAVTMIQFSLIVGVLMIVSIMFPISILKIRNGKEKSKD